MRTQEKPKIISLFSGCGGLDLGFHKAGYQMVWANDIEHFACESFSSYFGKGIIRRELSNAGKCCPTLRKTPEIKSVQKGEGKGFSTSRRIMNAL